MKKNLISIIIFMLSGIILALGICQLILYIPAQLDMVDNALLQGATEEQISDYYWHELIPQIITYVITFLGFAAVLFATGMLYLKLAVKQPSYNRNMDWPLQSKDSADEELDDFFDEFEAINAMQEK
ncbi:hypothetical protein RE628_19850 [Paenibacillus sp. D2_2]|uniref:hypothetical protein n=1 Tax=Paenibacillus sp. D2_2 TaxID=3073092 RepID=UPI002815E7B4|nr:hypothetical protein [Paenibacillus sp. D2_2]WMT39638.1 hypothetical protein RE628_19850 [Paenibacillus sp. D2_2]